MFDSRDVAAYIAQRCREREIGYNNTKIQKLLYCVYGCMLAYNPAERPFDEHARAWQYGPVFPKVFNYFHKHQDIAGYSSAVKESGEDSRLLVHMVEQVLDTFGGYPASQLSAWTHKKGSPWDRVVNGTGEEDGAGLNGFIPDEFIRSYFWDKVLEHE